MYRFSRAYMNLFLHIVIIVTKRIPENGENVTKITPPTLGGAQLLAASGDCLTFVERFAA